MLDQPPRLAVWLVSVFSPYTQAEAIAGDLVEEFSEVASREGAGSARWWYWWQSVKTITHLFAAAFRSKPWLMAVSIFAGWLTGGFLLSLANGFTRLAVQAAAEVLKRYPVYHYINAHLFWVIYNPNLMFLFIVSLLQGCVVAAIARGRETIAAVSLSLLLGTHHTIFCLWWWPPLRPHEFRISKPDFLLQFVLTNSLVVIVGGYATRKIRSSLALARRRSIHAA